MDAYSEAKSMRLLTMYSRLLDGKILTKRELAEEFGIAERSVQRDMEHCVMELEYAKMDGSISRREVEPVGLMFSEYYFYLVAFLHNDPRTDHYKQSGTLLPTIYRVDRIQGFTVQQEHFTPAYASRFQEGEFRKRIQFMFGGKLNRIRFKYTGPSIEAVLDRLPTAQILEQDEEGWTIEVEVFGKGIEMWLRSQGEMVTIIEIQ